MCRKVEWTYPCEMEDFGEDPHNHDVWTVERCNKAKDEHRDDCGHWDEPVDKLAKECKNTTCCWSLINNALMKWARIVKKNDKKSSERSQKYGTRAYEKCKEHEKSCGFKQYKFHEMRDDVIASNRFNKSDLKGKYHGAYRW